MYREHLPSPRLRRWVECLWTSGTASGVAQGRVFPDGCVDILYLRGSGGAELQAVGAMTRVHTVAMPPDLAVGIRFRPGAARAFLKLPLGEATDRSISLADLWGRQARQLSEHLDNSTTVPEMLHRIEAALLPPVDANPAQNALLSLPRDHAQWSPDELARQAGFSPRHFRRLCLDETGLTPKRLWRVLRFRRALQRVRFGRAVQGHVNFASLATECGYYDQAHLIREFRELADCTPGGLSRQVLA